MTLDNVRRLRQRSQAEPELRKRLNQAEDQAQREAVLASEGLSFTNDEFEEMFNVLHTECQTKDEAESLFEFRNWWGFLTRS